MGACESRSPKDREISKALHKAGKERKYHKAVRILLLGGSESGKSTIAKQMHILYNATDAHYSGEESECVPIYIAFGYCLTMFCRQIGVEVPREITIWIRSNQIKKLANFLEPLVDDLSALVNETKTFSGAHDATFKYLLEHRKRILSKRYVPTNEDILRIKQRTTGVSEINAHVDGMQIDMVDVGGQKAERRKWIHCFEGVNIVFYVVGLGDYDLRCDQRNTTALRESLEVFKQVLSLRMFADKPLVILYNKNDLLKEKATKIDLRTCFPDYKGGLKYENALNFIKDKFRSLIPPDRPFSERELSAIDSGTYFHFLKTYRKNCVPKFLLELFFLVLKNVIDKFVDIFDDIQSTVFKAILR
mmetsp:Transcript_20745/g.23067  ORF Transcript_20745/g.23067 Transcript_20745/m.23067 type:complete len:361 (-) Transcript_20745:390-1472(-)